ncbi:hypothetical protein GCM10011529_30580 [Polymorphobacter glacialis]|uniref:Helix-hairpin-helix domain-containing protein n=1 Tax=Sandarakinorhabdus glacialis TaxID=1614636 RepID=A0A917A1J6_9SPHN|nr:helix-hairpin-helix domain-containing protein [Polymorphobacter glacialis]GGE21838.1 hypothetical protein GCM10011529_30580 [Polymorphobacter glacialis]
MSIFSRLFGRFAKSRNPAQLDPERFDIPRGVNLRADADIIRGFQFCATLQLRTPLRVLSRHGEIFDEIDRAAPQIAKEQWEGIWVPKLRSWKEMGFDIKEMQGETMASSVGQIPRDGGNYLKFLKAVRIAAEADSGIVERRAEVAKALLPLAWSDFVRAHLGADAILDQLFPPFLSTVPRLAAKTGRALIEAGFNTPASINAASDATLTAVAGVGPAALRALRETACRAANEQAEYVDRVIR